MLGLSLGKNDREAGTHIGRTIGENKAMVVVYNFFAYRQANA